MSIEAELPDGTVLEFPDGTDPVIVQQRVKEYLSRGGAGQTNTPPAPKAQPSKPSPLAGKPAPPPLAGAGRSDFVGKILQLGDQMGRTYGGAAADLAQGTYESFVTKPLGAVLNAVGIDNPYDAGIGLAEKIPQPVGAPSQFTRAIAPYLFGSATTAKALPVLAEKALAHAAPKVAPVAAQAIRAAPGAIRTGVAAGAPVDAAMSAVQDANLSNLVEQVGGPTLPMARRPDDSAGEAALKDMAEGGAAGATLELAMRALTGGLRGAPKGGVMNSLPGASSLSTTPPIETMPAPHMPQAAAIKGRPVEVLGPPQPLPDGQAAVPVRTLDDGTEGLAPIEAVRPIEVGLGQPRPPAPVVEEMVAPATAGDLRPVPVDNVEALPPANPIEPRADVSPTAVELTPPALKDAEVVPTPDPTAAVAAEFSTGPQIWRGPDGEGPVEVVGEPLPGPDGRVFAPVRRDDGSLHFAPVDELEAGSRAGGTAPQEVAAKPPLNPMPGATIEQVVPSAPPGAPLRASGVPTDAPPASLMNRSEAPGTGPTAPGGQVGLDGSAIDETAPVKSILAPLGDPVARSVKGTLRAVSDDITEVSSFVRGLKAATAKTDGPKFLGKLARTAWVANADAAHAIAKKYPQVREAQDLADMIGTDPGRGRAISQTYERAVEMRARGMQNRLRNVLGQSTPELEQRVVDALAGRVKLLSGSQEEATARRVRRLLDEQYDYLRESGLDVGYVRGTYFPRVLDTEKVIADPAGFQTRAAEVYRSMGLPEAEATAASADWYQRVLGIGGPGRGAEVASSYTKGRTLPAEADKILENFYVGDPKEVLGAYMLNTSRTAEFARRFGVNGEHVTKLFDEMRRKGVDSRDVDLLEAHFRSATGQLSTTKSNPLQATASTIQAAGVLALLSRAPLSSLGEYFSIGVRAHAPVKTSYEVVKQIIGDILRLPDEDRSRELGEMMGILGDAASELVIASRFDGDVSSQAARKTLARFFRTTGLHQLTEHQRLVALRIGQRFIGSLLDDLAPGSKRAASARRLITELGMEDADVQAVRTWLADNDGRVPIDRIWENSRGAGAYRTALQRFVDESIMSPSAADRPLLANHPAGRLAYGLSSFIFAFTRNVLVRTGREVGEGLYGKGYTLEDRLRLTSPAIGLGILTAVQSQLSEFRDQLFNPERAAERSTDEKVLTNLSRSGAFGTLDPFVNYFMSARYERDPTSLLTGPYLAFFLDFLADQAGLLPGLNSERTNNAEHRAAKSAYAAVLAPTAAMIASWLPGSPAMRLGYGGMLMVGTSGGAAREFADALVGERTIGRRPATDDEDAALYEIGEDEDL